MKIGIIGQGFVGTAVYEGLKSFFNIETFDVAKDCTCDSLESLLSKTNTIFVCLPTPMDRDGKCYTGIVEEVLKDINEITTRKKTLIIKSTIPPGTTEGWNKKYDNMDLIRSIKTGNIRDASFSKRNVLQQLYYDVRDRFNKYNRRKKN